MLIPYRVKNPPKRFPIATVSIIAINVIVYVLTTQDLLIIREDVVRNYAFAMGISPFWNFFSAAFLHGDITHILGNMLFFWIFGPPVESRLGIPKFIAFYLATGLAGDFLQALVDVAAFGHAQPGIGASGCILGIMGAYWYLFPSSTVCIFYLWGLFFRFWHGVWEVQAVWVIGCYVALCLGDGILMSASKTGGGVAEFCHVGGALAGVLLCFLLRIKRDTEAVSEAKALQADTKDLSLASVYALQAMLADDPRDRNLLSAMITAAAREHNPGALDLAFAEAGPNFIDIDPALVASYLLDLRGAGSAYSPVHLLRLAGRLEQAHDVRKAYGVYQLIAEKFGSAPETETALFRMAQCCWNVYKDGRTALACLTEMNRRFPRGEMTAYGKQLQQQIEGQQR